VWGLSAIRWSDLSAHHFYHLFVFVVGANLNPNEICAIFYSKSPVIAPGSDRPQLANFLEMQGGMSGVFFQNSKVLLCNLLDGWWELIEAIPETPGCSVHLKILQLAATFLVESLANEEIQFA